MTQTAYGERRDSEGPQDPNWRHGGLGVMAGCMPGWAAWRLGRDTPRG